MRIRRPGVRAVVELIVRSASVLLPGLALTPPQAAGQHASSSAQVSAALGTSVELGVIAATPFAEDGNGVTVRAGVGPFVGGSIRSRIDPRFVLTSGLRVSASALRVESSAGEWRAGTTWQTDLRIGLETSVTRRLKISGSASVARATGPQHVVPFRAGGGSVWMWGSELAGHVTVPRHPRIAVVVAAGAARVASQSKTEPPLDGGWIGQLRLGVRGDIR